MSPRHDSLLPPAQGGQGLAANQQPAAVLNCFTPTLVDVFDLGVFALGVFDLMCLTWVFLT